MRRSSHKPSDPAYLKIVRFHPGHSCAEQAYTGHCYVHWKLFLHILRKRCLIWMKIHRQKLFHPIALCGPVCVLLSAEPSACVCLSQSFYVWISFFVPCAKYVDLLLMQQHCPLIALLLLITIGHNPISLIFLVCSRYRSWQPELTKKTPKSNK